MNLAEALAERTASGRRLKGPACTVWTILATLNADDTQAFRDAMVAEPRIPSRAIAEALSEHGQRVGPETLDRHRRNDCACDRREAQVSA